LESGVEGALALTRLLTNIPKYRTHSHPSDEFGLARGKDKNITERLDWTPQRMAAVDFAMPTELIERATSMRSEMVRQLRYNPTLAMMKQMNDRSQSIESEAGDVILKTPGEDYSGKYDPIKAMMDRNMNDLLKKVIDRCRDAANAISRIVPKNS
jgi:hypothetical protein